MSHDAVEVEARGVHPRADDAVFPVAAMAYRRGCPADPALSIVIGAGDAHALALELRGERTPRSQAVDVVSRVANALGGRLAAAGLPWRTGHGFSAGSSKSKPRMASCQWKHTWPGDRGGGVSPRAVPC